MELQEALAGGQFSRLAPILDAQEIETADDLSNWPAALHLLGHIHNSELEDARLLHKRLPAAAAQDAQVQAAHRLLQLLWQKDYQGVHGALRSDAWSPELRPLVTAVEQKTRADIAALLSRAYAHISAQRAAELLGVDASGVQEVARSQGWEHIPGSDSYKITRQPGSHAPLTDPEQIRRLTEFVVHLEA